MPVSKTAWNDNDLYQRVKEHGDMDAFHKLYERYVPAVLGFSYRIIGNRELAEEIAQETFWRLWKNASSFDPVRGTFPNWMFGIARNLSIDSLRRVTRVTIQPLFDESERGDDAVSPPLKVDGELVAEEAWLKVKREQVRLAMAELPPEQRDVIIWIYFEGKTRREIAAEQNIPFGTVNTRARLALQKLQASLIIQGIEE